MFFCIKWSMFLIILQFLSTEVHSENLEINGTSVVSFRKSWFSKPREYFRIILITKHMGRILSDVVHMPRNESHSNKIEKNVLSAIDYLLEGFNFIENITKNDNKYPTDSKSDLIVTSKYNETLIKCLEIFEEIEMIFYDYFESTKLSVRNSTLLDQFFDRTITNEGFPKKILFDEFFRFPNSTSWFSKGFHKTIFHMYFETLQQQVNLHKICGVSMTKLLFDFYERTLVAVIKGYTMIIIGYEYYNLRHLGFDLKTIKTGYLEKYLSTTKKVLYSANELHVLITIKHRTNKQCDPNIWEEERNYIRVKNYVSDRSENAAINDNRSFILKTKSFKEYECENFELRSNFVAESIDSMRCPEVFETNSQSCLLNVDKEFTYSRNDYPFWNVTCYDKTANKTLFNEYCYCDQHSDKLLSIRTLSLREHTTNAEENRVVTGIRFVVKNNEISIEIQEGKIDFGIINPDSVRWVTEEGRDPEKGPPTVKLSFKFRSFDLDDIDLPVGYIVTGVRFGLLEHNHIGLVVRGTHMWDDSGMDTSWHHQWFYPTTSPRDLREKILIKDCKNSAEVSVQNHEISRSGGHYVDLSVGTLSNNFNNLPVIPFFDSQDVQSNFPAPLGGLGLFYKGQNGYGGFLAFKLIASKYSYNFYSDLVEFNDI